MRVTCLAVPPLFYIIAAEKDRLKSFSQIGPLVQSTQNNEGEIPSKVISNLKSFLGSCSSWNQSPEELHSGGAESGGGEGGGAGGVDEGGGADRGERGSSEGDVTLREGASAMRECKL